MKTYETTSVGGALEAKELGNVDKPPVKEVEDVDPNERTKTKIEKVENNKMSNPHHKLIEKHFRLDSHSEGGVYLGVFMPTEPITITACAEYFEKPGKETLAKSRRMKSTKLCHSFSVGDGEVFIYSDGEGGVTHMIERMPGGTSYLELKIKEIKNSTEYETIKNSIEAK